MRYVTIAEESNLRDLLWTFKDSWPEFMLHDPVAERLYGEMVEHYPDLQALLFDGDRPVAKSHAIGFVWSGELDDLPERGWDAIMERGVADGRSGQPPTAVSAIEVNVRADRRGTGLSQRMLQGMRETASQLGVSDLFAPVRPSAKSERPREPISSYAYRTREDGQLVDPWLRTHARLGASIVKVCPTSMTIPGTLEQWREWTGLPFATSGDIEVPGGLVPVHVDVDQDHAVYVEPNLWMHHRLGVAGT